MPYITHDLLDGERDLPPPEARLEWVSALEAAEAEAAARGQRLLPVSERWRLMGWISEGIEVPDHAIADRAIMLGLREEDLPLLKLQIRMHDVRVFSLYAEVFASVPRD